MLKPINNQRNDICPCPNQDIVEHEPWSARSQVPTSIPEETVQEPTEIRIPVFSNDQEETFGSQEGPFNGDMIREEQASFFRKTFAILSGMIAWMILAIDETENLKKIESFGLLALLCLTFCMLENCMFCMRQYRAGNDYKEHLFDALDGIFALSFSFTVIYWDQESISRYWLATSSFLYLIFMSKYIKGALPSSITHKNMKIFMRFSLTIQALLITAKFLGFIAFIGWTTVFFPLGSYLVVHQIYGSYSLVKSSVKLWTYAEIENLSFIRGSFRMSCHVVNHGLFLLAFGIFIDLCNQTEEKGIQRPLGIFLLIAECFNGLFFGYALIFFKLVRGLDPELSEDFDQDMMNNYAKPASLVKKYSLVSQKDELSMSRFLKISQTYFVKADLERKEEEVSQIEESLCYICEENKPNIILMSCGHGGMCKDCVLQSMKKNNSCMQCRKPVSSIYQIKKEEKSSGVVEACEAFAIVC